MPEAHKALLEIGGRIKEGRETMGLTQQELANAVGVSVQAVSQWETGKTLPGLDRIFAIASALQTQPDWFIQGNAVPLSGSTMVPVPLLTRSAVVRWDDSNRLPWDHAEKWLVPTKPPIVSSVFAFELSDESMMPQFKIGDHVFIDTTANLIPGAFVLVVFRNLRSEDLSTVDLRKYRPHGRYPDHTADLIPLNPDFPSAQFPFPEGPVHVSILGSLVEHRTYPSVISSVYERVK